MTNGERAIMFAVMATCDPGEEILIPEPFYANYNAFSKCVNVNIVPITTKAEEGFHLPPRKDPSRYHSQNSLHSFLTWKP